MTINRATLLEDVKTRMRSDNVFTDSQMQGFISYLVTSIGDDDDNYSEILCKSLRTIAENNAALATETGAYKKIRTEELEEEFYQGSNANTWDDYLGRLDTLCASFGYTELETYTTGFMCINTGDAIDVNPTSSGCSTTSYSLSVV